MVTKQLIRNFDLPTLVKTLPQVIEALSLVSSWYALAKGNYQTMVSYDLVKALGVLVTLFGPPKTTSSHYVLRHGNDLISNYQYDSGEPFPLKDMPGPYATYNFEVCTWFARILDLDRYVVVRIEEHLPCFFSHHYLRHCLQHLRDLDPGSLLGFGVDPTEVSQFVHVVYTCTFRYDANTEPPAYWVHLEHPAATVVHYHERPAS